MVYTKLVSNKSIELINNKYLNLYDNNIPYYCRENYERLLFETYNTSRNYEVLINYFLEFINNNIIFNEWYTNFEVIKDNGEYKKFLKQLKILNYTCKKNSNYETLLKQEIDYIKEQILNYKYLDKNLNYVKNCDLKYTVKSVPLNILYNFLSIISFINNTLMLKLDKISSGINVNLERAIYNYLWSLLRLQIVLDDYKIDLSSHSQKEINMQYLKEKYIKIYNDDFVSNINKSIKKMFDNIIYLINNERMK